MENKNRKNLLIGYNLRIGGYRSECTFPNVFTFRIRGKYFTFCAICPASEFDE